MKALKETGKTLTLDIQDTVKLFRFIKKCVNWDFDFYRNHLREIDPSYEDWTWYFPTLSPRFLILPDFRYSPVDSDLREQGRIKGNDPKIRLENFSTYNIFEIASNDNSPIANIFISLMINQYKDIKKTEITGLSLNVTSKDKGFFAFPLRMHPREDLDIKLLENSLQTLLRAKGKRYPTSGRSEIFKKIVILEDTMTATLNFLYAIYTGEYEKNKESKLFEPLTKLLRSYGNTFEDSLSTVKELVTIIG